MAPLGSTVATEARTNTTFRSHAYVDHVEVSGTSRAGVVGVAVQDVYAAEARWDPASLILLNVFDPTLD